MKIVKRSLGFVFKCAQYRDRGLVDKEKKRHIQEERGLRGAMVSRSWEDKEFLT